MNKTAIEWADFSWNPIVGCRNGCDYCYARRLATTRLAHLCPQCGTFEPHLHLERIEQPLRMKKPAVIFADSMSDWWSEGVDPWWRIRAVWTMVQSPQHQFVVLTKRPDLIVHDEDNIHWPPNAWLGVSITSGEDWWRWEALAKLPERIHKFISVEPLLGAGVAGRLKDAEETHTALPEWVIVGPQSGSGAAKPVEAWQFTIRDMTYHLGIPLFEKPHLPLQPPVRQMPRELAMVFRKGYKEKTICNSNFWEWK